MEDLHKHEEIVDVSFDEIGSHLAICHEAQGGAASGWHQSLLLKTEETEPTQEIIKALEQVNVKLSFEEFVRKFFGMYYDDAELLAKLMGFQTEYEYGLEQEDAPDSYEAYVADKASKFEIMKSCFDSESFETLAPNDALEVIKTQVLFETALAAHEDIEKTKGDDIQATSEDPHLQSSDLPEDIKKEATASDVKPEDSVRTDTMEAQDFLKSAEAQDLIKAEIAKATEVKDVELAKAVEALEKAAAELEEFKIEKAERKLKGFVNFTKSLSFVEEEKQEALAQTLLKASDVEGMEMIVEMLEKAQEKVEAVKQEFLKAEEGFETKADEPVVIDKSKELADRMADKWADKKFQH